MLVVRFDANCFALFKKQYYFLFCQMRRKKNVFLHLKVYRWHHEPFNFLFLAFFKNTIRMGQSSHFFIIPPTQCFPNFIPPLTPCGCQRSLRTPKFFKTRLEAKNTTRKCSPKAKVFAQKTAYFPRSLAILKKKHRFS